MTPRNRNEREVLNLSYRISCLLSVFVFLSCDPCAILARFAVKLKTTKSPRNRNEREVLNLSYYISCLLSLFVFCPVLLFFLLTKINSLNTGFDFCSDAGVSDGRVLHKIGYAMV